MVTHFLLQERLQAVVLQQDMGVDSDVGRVCEVDLQLIVLCFSL